MLTHHFTVDVEEHFQVSALEPYVLRARWGELESRVAHGVYRLLDLLARYDSGATFFVLGWVAERHPMLVRTIAGAGHEIASHGWDHRRVFELGREEFRSQARRSKALLEDITGAPVTGFRAPSFSIVPGCEWALDVLLEEGYRYDSSLFPIWRPGYGYPNGRRDPHRIERASGTIAEFPPTTVRWLGLTLPAGGGAYLRLLPAGLCRAALRAAERRGVPGTFYVHPWEVDPEQPRFSVPWLTRLRHYGGLAGTMARLDRLLQAFRFAPIGRLASASWA